MKIYKNGNSYYKMVRPVGCSNIRGYEHYALWQPVKKFLCFWINCRESFYLDMIGFIKV